MPQGISTVNVIYFVDINLYQIDELYSFNDDPEGNKQAEARFRELILEHHDVTPDDDEIEVATENGYFEFNQLGKVILLTHST